MLEPGHELAREPEAAVFGRDAQRGDVPVPLGAVALRLSDDCSDEIEIALEGGVGGREDVVGWGITYRSPSCDLEASPGQRTYPASERGSPGRS